MRARLGLWVTISEYAFTPERLRSLVGIGPAGIRLNMGRDSFAWAMSAIAMLVEEGYPPCRIYLDLANNKPRVTLGGLSPEPLEFELGEEWRVADESANSGHRTSIPTAFAAALVPGQTVMVGDGHGSFRVRERTGTGTVLVARSKFRLPHGTALHAQGGQGTLHHITEAESVAVRRVLREFPVSLILSFVETAIDLAQARSTFSKATVIPKIETIGAVSNFKALVQPGDTFMLGRGDLGLSVGLSKSAYYQRLVMQESRSVGAKAVIAGGLFESLAHSAIPSRAEVNDLFTAAVQGAAAVALTSETGGAASPIKVIEAVIPFVDDLNAFQNI